MEAIKQNKSFVPRTFPPRVPAYALHPAPASFRFTCHWTLLTFFLSTNVLASSPTILRPFLSLHGGVALSYLFKKQLRACGRGHHSHCTRGTRTHQYRASSYSRSAHMRHPLVPISVPTIDSDLPPLPSTHRACSLPPTHLAMRASPALHMASGVAIFMGSASVHHPRARVPAPSNAMSPFLRRVVAYVSKLSILGSYRFLLFLSLIKRPPSLRSAMYITIQLLHSLLHSHSCICKASPRPFLATVTRPGVPALSVKGLGP